MIVVVEVPFAQGTIIHALLEVREAGRDLFEGLHDRLTLRSSFTSAGNGSLAIGHAGLLSCIAGKSKRDYKN